MKKLHIAQIFGRDRPQEDCWRWPSRWARPSDLRASAQPRLLLRGRQSYRENWRVPPAIHYQGRLLSPAQAKPNLTVATR